MGYDTTFKLKGELDPIFDTVYKSVPEDRLCTSIVEQRVVLLAHCLYEDNLARKDLMVLYRTIALECSVYVHYLIEKWKYDLNKNLKEIGEVHFRGWEYCRSNMCEDGVVEQDVVNRVTEDLFLIAILKSNNPLMSGDSTYYEKKRLLLERIDEVEYFIENAWNKKFIEFYRDSDKAVEEGDDTPEQNEEENAVESSTTIKEESKSTNFSNDKPI